MLHCPHQKNGRCGLSGVHVTDRACEACSGADDGNSLVSRLIDRRTRSRVENGWRFVSTSRLDEYCETLKARLGAGQLAEALLAARKSGMDADQAVSLARKHCPNEEVKA